MLKKLNCQISKEKPELISKAGKLGVAARIRKQKRSLSGLFDAKKRIQRKVNLVRWTVVINNVRISYKKLSSEFVNYFVEYGLPQ